MEISVFDILAGDVLHLEPGNLAPADGVLISGHNVLFSRRKLQGTRLCLGLKQTEA
jgi:Ca2+-transporting ATPase